jgi:hypothetical protein
LQFQLQFSPGKGREDSLTLSVSLRSGYVFDLKDTSDGDILAQSDQFVVVSKGSDTTVATAGSSTTTTTTSSVSTTTATDTDETDCEFPIKILQLFLNVSN